MNLGTRGWASPLLQLVARLRNEGINSTTPVTEINGGTLSATNADIALVAKGTGATLAQVPDGTVAGGNKRGIYATDLQKVRALNTQVAAGPYAAVLSGDSNKATSTYDVVGGGYLNTASGSNSTVVGGDSNNASSTYSFVGGGRANNASGSRSAIAGGDTVTASGSRAAVTGGQSNTASSDYSFVGGGQSNTAQTNTHATVCGGSTNTASGLYAFVGGGARNTASASNAVIAGGVDCIANNTSATVGGGNANQATANSSTVSGGTTNTASALYAVVCGGAANTANGEASAVLGGRRGTARGIVGYFVSPACSAPIASVNGVTQSALLLLGRQTTDATATVLTSDSAAASTTNQVILPNNSAYSFSGEVIAGVTAAGDTARWTINGAIKRGANAASTVMVGTPTVTMTHNDAGASAWTVAVTADTTNGGIAVTVTGAASTTIRWVAKLNTTEMTY